MAIIHDNNSNAISNENPLPIQSNAKKATAVTPSDATVFPATKGLYVGVSGNVAVTMADGVGATFTGLTGGIIHPISVTKVNATGTTATSILAVY